MELNRVKGSVPPKLIVHHHMSLMLAPSTSPNYPLMMTLTMSGEVLREEGTQGMTCTFSYRWVSKGGKMSSSGSWVSNIGV